MLEKQFSIETLNNTATNTSKNCKINLIRARVAINKQESGERVRALRETRRRIKFSKILPRSMCSLMKNLSQWGREEKGKPGKRKDGKRGHLPSEDVVYAFIAAILPIY